MSRLAIRCDPQTAIATDEVERWLQREVERLRAAAPRASRLHRLNKTESTVPTGRGWLIELDATSEEDPLDRNRLDAALRDMRLLGLRPTLLAALENGDAVALVVPVRPNGETV